MEKFVHFMRLILVFMRKKYSFYGFYFSFFDVFIFSILGYLIFNLIGGLLRTGD